MVSTIYIINFNFNYLYITLYVLFITLNSLSITAEEACTVWCYKRNGGTKSRGWTFPDGTACQIKSNIGSMYCISGICQVRLSGVTLETLK